MPAAPLPPIRRGLILDLLRQLDIAREEIDEALRTATNADAVRRFQRQRAEIDRVFDVFRVAADGVAQGAADVAWNAGIAAAVEQSGVDRVAVRSNTRELLAIRHTLTDRIKDVSAQAIKQINTALTQHLLGVRTLSQTISDIQELLDHAPRRRAMTIGYTEVGRTYNAAHYEALLEQAKVVPGLKKRWIHSGKAHARPGHVLAAQQDPIPVDEPFRIVDPKTGEVEELRFPLDPNASAKNTINCGCMMEAVPPDVDELFAGPIGPIVPAEDAAPIAPPAPNIVQHAEGVLANLGSIAPWERASVRRLPKPLADALIPLERELPTRAVEWAYVLDDTGAIRWSAEGTRELVRLDGLSFTVARGAVLTHTHFDDALPSIFDVWAAAGHDLAELRVAGPNVRHRLLPPLSGWNLIGLLDQEADLKAFARNVLAGLREAGVAETEYDRRVSAALIQEMVRRGLFRIETSTAP